MTNTINQTIMSSTPGAGYIEVLVEDDAVLIRMFTGEDEFVYSVDCMLNPPQATPHIVLAGIQPRMEGPDDG